MRVQRARSVYWKKWAAKHKQEKLIEGAWIEPAPGLFRKKAKEEWTEKHRHVARKIFLEGGWTKKCQACKTEGGTEKHRLHHFPEWHEVRREIRSPSENGNKRRERRRKSGSGKEVSSRILSVKASGIEVTSA